MWGPAIGPGSILVQELAFWNLFPMVGASLSLDAGVGTAWSCLNLICHALLTLMGGLTFYEEWRGVERRWGREQRRRESGNCGWYVKINKFNKKVIYKKVLLSLNTIKSFQEDDHIT